MSSSFQPLTQQAFRTKIDEGAVVFDARSEEEFLNSFIPGAVFIGPLESNWEIATSLFDKKTPLIFVLPAKKKKIDFANADSWNLQGFLDGGYAEYIPGKKEIDLLIEIEADEFAMDIPFDPNMLILDVRDPEVFEKEHVKNALNIPLSDMGDIALIADFEDDQNIYIYGEDEVQGIMAASLIKRQGYNNLRHVRGGWQEIKKEKSISFKKASKNLDNQTK
jgi:rhodanese-related sulfurtransferase